MRECEGVSLSAICARSPENQAKARADHPTSRVYSDHLEMLSREKLELCDVVLPSDLHFPVARDVLEAGCNLLLEKPMALSVEHCSQLIRIAESRGKILAVGHELRMSSLWGKVKELIDTGAIGEPLYCLIELWRKPYRLGSGGWRYDSSRVGSWILEEPIHFFDLARWYMSAAGEPVSIYAAGRARRADHPELHDNFSAIVHFPHGKYAMVSQTLAGWEHHQTAKITGTDGAIWASWSGAMDRTFEPTFWLKLQRGADGPAEMIEIPKASGEVYELVDEINAVVRAVRDGSPVPCTGQDGWWSTAMCLKAEQSLQSGKPVALSAE
jgi:myo-inositol 2-dehydrogenase/D-chiro-inositol 1-dehydrogenase